MFNSPETHPLGAFEGASAEADQLPRTLDAMGPLHGYGIAWRIEQLSENALLLNQGAIYASLVRLQQRGWTRAEWGISDHNRRAKFYTIAKAGKRQMKEDRSYWERLSAVRARVLAGALSMSPVALTLVAFLDRRHQS
jgi:PadR family transcriptional regulator, regulatory protein PadR